MKEFYLKLKNRPKLILFLVLVVSAYLLLLFLFRRYNVQREDITNLLSPLGVWGILVAFLVLFAVALTPLPDTAFAFVTMVLYGPVIGSATIFSAMFLATVINYFIARGLGSSFIFKHFPETESYLDKFGKNLHTEGLIVLRFFSLVSFDIVAYIASLAKIPFWKFLIASVIGLIPLVISHALLSQGLFSSNPFEVMLSWVIPGVITFVFAYLSKVGKALLLSKAAAN